MKKLLTSCGGDEISCRTLVLIWDPTPTARQLIGLLWASMTVALSCDCAMFGTPSEMIIATLGTSDLSPCCGTNMSDISNWKAPVVLVSPPVYVSIRECTMYM